MLGRIDICQARRRHGESGALVLTAGIGYTCCFAGLPNADHLKCEQIEGGQDRRNRVSISVELVRRRTRSEDGTYCCGMAIIVVCVGEAVNRDAQVLYIVGSAHIPSNVVGPNYSRERTHGSRSYCRVTTYANGFRLKIGCARKSCSNIIVS